jgi:hypothetical protein
MPHAAGLVEHRLKIARQPGFPLGRCLDRHRFPCFGTVWPETPPGYKPKIRSEIARIPFKTRDFRRPPARVFVPWPHRRSARSGSVALRHPPASRDRLEIAQRAFGRLGGQFRHPPAAIASVGVELLGLRLGVEHPEIGRGVGPGPRRPLPAHGVGGRVPVHEALLEPVHADLPMGHQVLGQVRGHQHPRAVVHPARDIHLAHRRIDDRHARAPPLPGSDLLARGVGIPRKRVPLLAPVAVHDMGRVKDEVMGEVAPDELLQEGLGAGLALLHRAQARPPAGPRGHLAMVRFSDRFDVPFRPRSSRASA